MSMINPPRTLVEALQASHAAVARPGDGEARPAAVLWTDPGGQWQGLMPTLRKAMPHLLCLGKYDPVHRTGPAIWMRCVLAGTLSEPELPRGEQAPVPVLYLPGVSRAMLRHPDECPPEAEPLVELMFRGIPWHQRNNRDWTVEAFLASAQGLDLDVAQDSATRAAMVRALPQLATLPLDGLRGRRLDVDDFEAMVNPDPQHDLLAWMSDPKGVKEEKTREKGGEGWAAFRQTCVRTYAFDPEADGVEAAGRLLVKGEGKWNDAWHRFCRTPQAYKGISKVLRMSFGDLFATPSRRPGFNEQQEKSLEAELRRVVDMDAAAARARVLALDEEHRERRDWVWAGLGESVYAQLLAPLAELARRAGVPVGGATPAAVADAYATDGWRCDAAAIAALAAAPVETRGVVERVVRALMADWLDAGARHLQTVLAAAEPAALWPEAVPVRAEKGTCILFADGLRYDVAMALVEALEARELVVRTGHRLAPLPTVTATAKPYAMPVADACRRGGLGDDFAPVLEDGGKTADSARLVRLMKDRGVAVLAKDETAAPEAAAGGWTECGSLDTRGHSLQSLIATQVADEVVVLAERIQALLRSGWRRVRVVTDHGWLLLPGGLPKVDLPPAVSETKWARCAIVSGDAQTSVPVHGWYWNPHTRIASPPGAGTFYFGAEYAHGGISPQECVIPDLMVEAGVAAVKARIVDLAWKGLRLAVSVETNGGDLTVDIRTVARKAASSVALAAKALDSSGEASLVVENEDLEGSAVCVVVLDAAGDVLDQQTTTVGDR